MRRMSNHIASAAALTVLACGSIWGAPKLLSQLELSSVSGTAVESLSAVGLNVENVTVEGRVKTDPADILDALGPARGTLILAIDVPQARQRIAALPWVRSAEIVRQLPNSLHITLDEHVAFALWQSEGKYKLVAKDGTSIAGADSAQPGLTILVGKGAPKNAASLFEALSEQPHLKARVRAAVRLGSHRWNVILDAVDQGIIIKLPEQDVSAAWDTLAAFDSKHGLLGKAVAEVDLRIAGRLTVKLLDGYAPIDPNNNEAPPAQDVQWDREPAKKKESANSV